MQRAILSLLHCALAFKLCVASPSEQQQIVGVGNTPLNAWDALVTLFSTVRRSFIDLSYPQLEGGQDHTGCSR